jgi:hypothetical protein
MASAFFFVRFVRFMFLILAFLLSDIRHTSSYRKLAPMGRDPRYGCSMLGAAGVS